MTGARVLFEDEEPNGLAVMIGGLIEANLVHHPRRAELLRPAVVGLFAVDADVGVTLAFERGSVRIANAGSDGRADLRVSADSIALIELAGTPLRLGLPDVLHREGRRAAREVLSGRIRIEGMARHPLTLSRVTRLLSVV